MHNFLNNILFAILNTYLAKKPNNTQIRVKNLIALVKIKKRAKSIKIKKIIIAIFIIIFQVNLYQPSLKIHFIDVGQGDSCLIITPKNKTILIDGGGSLNSDFDVGKNTLLPYILDRGYTKIDIVIISHFDNDHVGGILSLLEEITVDKIYISKQIEGSSNYYKFLEIVNKKDLKVQKVVAGNRINIEKNLYLDILWPSNQQITTNVLNNNAIVCNLHYRNFSMLFTGDIEEIAEKEILKFYSSNKHLLNSDILKVAHHGSKTSSTKEFLDVVNPKIAIIGVGKNNNFGHPNEGVLNRLQSLNCKVFRTDLNGEISIKVNKIKKISYKVQL